MTLYSVGQARGFTDTSGVMVFYTVMTTMLTRPIVQPCVDLGSTGVCLVVVYTRAMCVTVCVTVWTVRTSTNTIVTTTTPQSQV
ncbi:hypothetical protein Pmani_014245 [Petrolisthes manimaculis]|uniref:Uncharacterized protein n=1 Tax=Petrolisthes manimaculis TaxID=1843537 RepID=A0AAE1UCW0_9EUCA|nr:hypothetical protein Pmani_014245 [Petrolisthes manimaculis]